MSETRYHVGCQSWGYEDWVTPAGAPTVFYPRNTKHPEMLELYSRVFDTIEVDATLYGVPVESTVKKWYAETPVGFSFSLKFPREVTHDRALRGPSLQITREFVDRASLLKEKLALFLIQFPAAFEPTDDNLNALRQYLRQLPKGFQFAMEFRNEGWFVDEVFEMLERSNVSLCLVEGKWVDREIMFRSAGRGNTDFRYIRIMGERDLPRFDRIYRHRDDVLDLWTEKIRTLPAGDVYIYSDNYFEGFAPATVNKVLTRLGLPSRDPAVLEQQGSLF